MRQKLGEGKGTTGAVLSIGRPNFVVVRFEIEIGLVRTNSARYRCCYCCFVVVVVVFFAVAFARKLPPFLKYVSATARRAERWANFVFSLAHHNINNNDQK